MSATRAEPPWRIAGAKAELPEGWTAATLGQVVSLSKEKMAPAGRPDLPYVGLEHIESGTNKIVGRGLAGETRSTKAVFHPGDVLYGKLRPYLNKVCVADCHGVCSTDILVLRPNSVLDGRFLMHFLSRPEFVELANHRSRGLSLPRVSYEDIADVAIPIPTLEEQRRICMRLEALRAFADSAHIRLARLRAILKQFRQAVLAAACSGRLTEDWREQHGSDLPGSRDGMASCTPATEALPDLAQLPLSWCWRSVKEIASVRGGIQKQPSRAPRHNAFPYLRVANVLRDRLDLDEITEMELFEGELEVYRLKPGDLLIVEGNGSLSEVGRSAIWTGAIANCVHQNHIIRVRATRCLPAYLNAYWNSPQGRELVARSAVTTSGLYSLSTKKVANMPVPFAPNGEQAEIVRRIEALWGLAESVERRVAAAMARTEWLTQSVLSKAFRGELVPTEAELARRDGREYEPAAVLLERITGEREERERPPRAGPRRAGVEQ